MKKKKNEKPLEPFATPDTNPEMNKDLENKKENNPADEMDMIFNYDTDAIKIEDDELSDNSGND